MTDDAWASPDGRCLGVRLNGDAIAEIDERGERVVGDTLVMLINGGVEAVRFTLPALAAVERWETLDRHRRSVADAAAAARQRALPAPGPLGRRAASCAATNGKLHGGDWGPMGVY